MSKFKCLIIIVLSVFSCSNSNEDSMDGVWESIGYGRILKVQDGEFLLADVTKISCNPTLSAETAMFGDNIGVKNDTLFIKDGINNYQFTRIENAPNTCKEELSEAQKNSPDYNFNVLSEIFTEHYAYFKERNIDWETLKRTFQSKITDQTSTAEFYNIVSEMLEQFNDGHISLSAPDAIEEKAEALLNNEANAGVEKPLKTYRRRQVANALTDVYFQDVKSERGSIIKWAILDDNVGYIQLNQMMGFANYVKNADSLSTGKYWNAYFKVAEEQSIVQHDNNETNGASEIMKNVIKDLNSTDAIIIDVRFNGGGKDIVALNILSFFNTKEQIVFSKKAKTKNGFTKPNHITLLAHENAYTKPVYLLTGGGSASATEIFALASMSVENITRVGEATKGVFSDVLEKELPNGWELGLSNEVYQDLNGKSYEGLGISPDIKMSASKDVQEQYRAIMTSLNNGKDKTIEKVLSL